MQSEKIILGIDPGTNIMGYGLLKVRGSKLSLISMGVIQLSKYSGHPLKLKKIFERTLSLIDEYHPDEMALEAPFFGKNVQSMLKLGRAQGVAMAAGLYRDMPIFEYSPRRIKQSITGKGASSKEQVAAMLHHLVPYDGDPKYLDATDGLAVAVCHHFQAGFSEKSPSYSGWAGFIAQNPDKVG